MPVERLAWDEAQGAELEVEGFALRLQRAGAAWSYQRSGLARHLLLAGSERPRLRVVARVRGEQAVARFLHPLVVPPRATLTVWHPWPLELAVLLPGGAELDSFRPPARRTLFGSVSDGVVLHSFGGAPLAGPEAPELAGRAVAALAIRLESRSDQPVRVPRVPVNAQALPLFRRGASLATGIVQVALLSALRAEGATHTGAPPPGFEAVDPPRIPEGSVVPIHGLHWLLEQTRSSAEFPL